MHAVIRVVVLAIGFTAVSCKPRSKSYLAGADPIEDPVAKVESLNAFLNRFAAMPIRLRSTSAERAEMSQLAGQDNREIWDIALEVCPQVITGAPDGALYGLYFKCIGNLLYLHGSKGVDGILTNKNQVSLEQMFGMFQIGNRRDTRTCEDGDLEKLEHFVCFDQESCTAAIDEMEQVSDFANFFARSGAASAMYRVIDHIDLDIQCLGTSHMTRVLDYRLRSLRAWADYQLAKYLATTSQSSAMKEAIRQKQSEASSEDGDTSDETVTVEMWDATLSQLPGAYPKLDQDYLKQLRNQSVKDLYRRLHDLIREGDRELINQENPNLASPRLIAYIKADIALRPLTLLGGVPLVGSRELAAVAAWLLDPKSDKPVLEVAGLEDISLDELGVSADLISSSVVSAYQRNKVALHRLDRLGESRISRYRQSDPPAWLERVEESMLEGRAFTGRYKIADDKERQDLLAYKDTRVLSPNTALLVLVEDMAAEALLPFRHEYLETITRVISQIDNISPMERQVKTQFEGMVYETNNQLSLMSELGFPTKSKGNLDGEKTDGFTRKMMMEEFSDLIFKEKELVRFFPTEFNSLMFEFNKLRAAYTNYLWLLQTFADDNTEMQGHEEDIAKAWGGDKIPIRKLLNDAREKMGRSYKNLELMMTSLNQTQLRLACMSYISEPQDGLTAPRNEAFRSAFDSSEEGFCWKGFLNSLVNMDFTSKPNLFNKLRGDIDLSEVCLGKAGSEPLAPLRGWYHKFGRKSALYQYQHDLLQQCYDETSAFATEASMTIGPMLAMPLIAAGIGGTAMKFYRMMGVLNKGGLNLLRNARLVQGGSRMAQAALNSVAARKVGLQKMANAVAAGFRRAASEKGVSVLNLTGSQMTTGLFFHGYSKSLEGFFYGKPLSQILRNPEKTFMEDWGWPSLMGGGVFMGLYGVKSMATLKASRGLLRRTPGLVERLPTELEKKFIKRYVFAAEATYFATVGIPQNWLMTNLDASYREMLASSASHGGSFWKDLLMHEVPHAILITRWFGAFHSISHRVKARMIAGRKWVMERHIQKMLREGLEIPESLQKGQQDLQSRQQSAKFDEIDQIFMGIGVQLHKGIRARSGLFTREWFESVKIEKPELIAKRSASGQDIGRDLRNSRDLPLIDPWWAYGVKFSDSPAKIRKQMAGLDRRYQKLRARVSQELSAAKGAEQKATLESELDYLDRVNGYLKRYAERVFFPQNDTDMDLQTSMKDYLQVRYILGGKKAAGWDEPSKEGGGRSE